MLFYAVFLPLFSVAVEGKYYTVVVKTSDSKWAGTDAHVSIRVRGTTGNINNRELDSNTDDFERGSKDTFVIQDHDIGYVKGMYVSRNEAGLLPNWKLDYIKIKVTGAADSIFNYNNWVSKHGWTKLTLTCDQGYEVNNEGYCDVKDIDECTVSNPCGPNSVCVNLVGSYFCRCLNGYEHVPGNSNQCQDKDECQNFPCDYAKSTCHNIPGDYQCNCKAGYQSIDSKLCENRDECASNTHSCDTSISTCVDEEGDYRCNCFQGYTQGSNNKLCNPVRCVALNNPHGGTFEPARCTQSNANVFGDKCIVKCGEGYIISDSSHGRLTCGSNTLWQGTMVRCNAISCPRLPLIQNGQIFPDLCTSVGLEYKRSCLYRCVSGYELKGNQFRYCKANGAWDGAEPTCKKIVRKPWISCPSSINEDLPPGQSEASVSSKWQEPKSNVEAAQITINPPEISSSYKFPVGQTKVTWIASNSVGSANCSIYVTLSDKEAPKLLKCPANIHQVSGGSKVVTWVEPSYSDNVKVTKIEASIPNGSVFSLGTTNVVYTAFDANGNRNDDCAFYVRLRRPPCYDPVGPSNGTRSCSVFGVTKFCQVTCDSGSRLYKESSLFWVCGNNGVWKPSDVIPDCVVASLKDSNSSCEDNRIEMTVPDLLLSRNVTYCAKCPSGMFKSSKTDCSLCAAGTYNNQQGQLQCNLACPAGTSSLPGAKSSSDCKPKCSSGRFSETGLGPNCHFCPYDTYQNQVQQTSCIPCPNGTSTVSNGADSLSDCGVKSQIIRMDPLVANINEGENVNVSCFATGIPTPTYSWTFRGNYPPGFLGQMSQPSIKNSNGEVIGSKLLIQGATYFNSGSYECKVTNPRGEDKALTQINVAKVFDSGSG
ncbi:sushi, von Willebrand factor type A, EGF and pentraxin domain-containing protein 1-like [Acropora millepora]|uniref:sushi, von Willebrand factor type A, EGF and pentraxin domain-containing protein 1-like n=1 Tax=Acropora millepora TaxID=45264 RepID=UPI001CF4D64D|nr:sushi, von Willebrand factor type A, EGF and pentraxin domain-containing protein 1-like [Acropora millepora]